MNKKCRYPNCRNGTIIQSKNPLLNSQKGHFGIQTKIGNRNNYHHDCKKQQ